jgi:hypothetical protein
MTRHLKSPEGLRVGQIAVATGMTPDCVRKAIRRGEARASLPVPPPPPVPHVRLTGRKSNRLEDRSADADDIMRLLATVRDIVGAAESFADGDYTGMTVGEGLQAEALAEAFDARELSELRGQICMMTESAARYAAKLWRRRHERASA